VPGLLLVSAAVVLLFLGRLVLVHSRLWLLVAFTGVFAC